MRRAASDTPSPGPILQGAADQLVTLALRPRGLRLGLGLMGEGHPVDPAFPLDWLIARDAGDEINKHHHAARRGLSLSFHAQNLPVPSMAVTLQHIGKAQ